LTIVGAATPEDAEVLARIHAASFSDPWDAHVIRDFLRSPEVVGVIAGDPPTAFGLCRRIVDEAEVLTLAVAPEHRRRGVGAMLVEAMADWARRTGAEALFLEVARDNEAGLALYRSAGFSEVGVRRAYYSRPTGAMDALVLRRELNR
jgi:ribosomal-protein-alanine N-acetyltransferase